MKRRLLYVLCIIAILAVSLTACQPAAQEEEEADKASVVLITPNPLGDRSFIDAAARGREEFMKDYPDVTFDLIETNGVAEHEAAMRNAIAKGYDMIIGLAIDSELMFSLCEEFPDQKFGSASEIFAEELPANMAGYVINVHESSFLVGVIVGSLTQTKTVGAVVGGDAPGLNQFFYGYKQGVLEVCPDCNVLVSYLGFDFSNPTLGLESALAQYDQGADIIYQIAGRSGEGVLQAANDRDLYAIGVDSNQDDTYPGHVIVSMIKSTNTTTYKLAEMAVKGFEPGFHSIGLSDGGAGLSWDINNSTTFADNGPAEMTAKLPDIKKLVEEYRAKILNGELKVCDALNEDPALCDPLK